MTVKQVAARMEVSVATIYALVAGGKLKCHRIGVGRGCIRIAEEHVAEYLTGAGPETPAMFPPSIRPYRPKHVKTS